MKSQKSVSLATRVKLLVEPPAENVVSPDTVTSFKVSTLLCLKPLSVLESVAVQRVFLNELITAALAWRCSLPDLPSPPSDFLQCCVHAIKNTRRKMEDKHVTLEEFNQLFGMKVPDHISPVPLLFLLPILLLFWCQKFKTCFQTKGESDSNLILLDCPQGSSYVRRIAFPTSSVKLFFV